MEQDSTFDESRERAVSSEPSSTRPNPFVDSDSTSRKRRRTSLAGSRSRSVETLPPQPETVVETEAEAEQIQAATGNNSTMKIDPPELVTPSTPPQSGSTPDSSPAGPHSSKVTINLRNIDNVGHAADSTSPTRSRPQFEEVKSSVEESEVEMVQALAGVDDIGSSPSAASDSDIPVELIRHDEEDDDVELVSIQSSAHHIDFNSIYLEFPYYTPETSLCDTVGRLTSFFTARMFLFSGNDG